MQYKSEPISWFQKKIRGDILVLNDHISKEMNELNLIRCQRIPKRPGADWRDLPDEKVHYFLREPLLDYECIQFNPVENVCLLWLPKTMHICLQTW